MSWRDRPYSGPDESGFGRQSISLGLLKPTPAVLGILITCFAIFLISSVSRAAGQAFGENGSLALPPLAPAWQVWRYVTYQYLHGGVWHIFLNMLGVFFFGPPLERMWGSRRFLLFYTTCGVAGGLAFAIMQMLMYPAFLIGASGSVLGCIGACAVLFPGMTVILFIFPVPIRFFAVLFAAIYTLTILSEHNLSDAAHLAGMATGALWVYGPSRWPALQLRRRPSEGAWQRKMRELAEDDQKVDHILDKIRKHGMQSLSWREKRFLHKATARRRQFDAQQSRRP
jgi:membrane associated rhomboid family serine protease